MTSNYPGLSFHLITVYSDQVVSLTIRMLVLPCWKALRKDENEQLGARSGGHKSLASH